MIVLILLLFIYYKFKHLPQILKYKTYNKSKYFLSVGAVFKNESHIFEEWIKHHLKDGVEHFYLVNDNSTDNYLPILQPYITLKIVTLYHNLVKIECTSRQYYAYTNFILPDAKRETEWLAILDLDEFATTRDKNTVAQNIKRYFKCATCVTVPWILFGSNGHKKQPKSIINSFTKRFKYDKSLKTPKNIRQNVINPAQTKSIFRPINYDAVFPHHPGIWPICPYVQKYFRSDGQRTHILRDIRLDEDELDDFKIVINHYMIQSEEFWKEIKCTRGDVYDKRKIRDMSEFNWLDEHLNEVDDFKLRDKFGM